MQCMHALTRLLLQAYDTLQQEVTALRDDGRALLQSLVDQLSISQDGGRSVEGDWVLV